MPARDGDHAALGLYLSMRARAGRQGFGDVEQPSETCFATASSDRSG